MAPANNKITVDGNEAAASVAFRLSEAIAIFPITPSSPMAEVCDEWASRGKTNLWGVIPAFANFAGRLDAAGVDGLVLFTRFHKVDIDVIELEVLRSASLSDSSELQLRLRATAVLAGRVKASLAISGGVHTALDVVKATMAGANVTHLVSAIVQNGPRYLRTLSADLRAWMATNEWDSLEEMRGNMSFQRIPDPAAYERATYRSFH